MGEGFEILEHTADVGLRARGDSLETVFEGATKAFAELAGAWRPRSEKQDEVRIEVEAPDPAGLLVDWLSEVLYLHDSRAAAVVGVNVERVAGGRAKGVVELAQLDKGAEGTQVKAITYHQLEVARRGPEWVATVYLDI